MVFYSAFIEKARLLVYTQWAIISICVCCSIAVPLYGGVSAVEREAHSLVLNAYPNLQGKPLAVVVLSVHNCTGCAATAVNNMTSILRQEEPSFACAVVVIGSDESLIAELRDKFFTPYVVADTIAEHSIYAERTISTLPLLVAFNSSEEAVFRQENIQEHLPDYTAMIAKIAKAPVQEEHSLIVQEQETKVSKKETSLPPQVDGESVVLEELSTHPAKNIGTIVRAGAMLVGLNIITGNLEVWNGETGAYLREVKVPDTVQYFYRQQADSLLWRTVEEEGYEMSRFEAIDAKGDTVYALAKVLAQYTRELRVEKSASGAIDSGYSINWQPGQVVVRIVGWKVDKIIPVPSQYPFFDIVSTTLGGLGGVCANALVATNNAEDSAAFFALLHEDESGTPWKATVWNARSTNGMATVGGKASAPDGCVWYCDPMEPVLVLFLPDGSRRDVVMKGTLPECASPITLVLSASDAASTDRNQPLYMLDNMVSVRDTLYVFLTPTEGASGLPCIVQSYTTEGLFLGEWTVGIPFAQQALWVHLLSVREGHAMVLLNTPDKRWRVVHVPIVPPAHVQATSVPPDRQRSPATR